MSATTLKRRVRRRLGLRPDFGHLDVTEPVSRNFGFDRGTPVDRYYIDRFLRGQRHCIVGRTLEIGDDSYTVEHGGTAVTQRDVLHIDPAFPATFHGDLSQAGVLPAESFDCAIVTQTLHLIYDMPAAVAQLHAALRPGGTLLVTSPGISQIADDVWGKTWYWSLTPASLTRMLDDAFGTGRASVSCYGNVFAATALLQGFAVEELPRRKLDVIDTLYPVIVAAAVSRAADD